MQKFTNHKQTIQKNSHINTRQIQIQPIHIPFDTNDSQASDTSYESSLSSNQQNNFGNAQYFRQEMSRFFINYPELLNQQLIGAQTNQKSLWGDLANDIINQAKQQPISLQGIAKRIAFYRQKTEQIDIIDLIVRQKDLILKQLEQQSKMVSQQNINSKVQDGTQKRTNNQSSENIYYSWKKRQQVALINDSRKNSVRKLISNSLHSHQQNKKYKAGELQFNSTFKAKSTGKNQFKDNKPKVLINKQYQITNADKVKQKKFMGDKKQQQIFHNAQNKHNSNSQSSYLKNILKFEPKTQTAKQLLEQIKKNNPHDQIGIKKTIVNFLAKHRDTMKKNVLSKSSLNQRLSKLHIQDSKQLLLFCPLKKNLIDSEASLSNQTNIFLQILNQISSGHLMKYWKLLQQRKL